MNSKPRDVGTVRERSPEAGGGATVAFVPGPTAPRPAPMTRGKGARTCIAIVVALLAASAFSVGPAAATHSSFDLGMPSDWVVLPGNINNAGQVVSGGQRVFFMDDGGEWQEITLDVGGTGFDWIWAQYEHDARSMNSWGLVAGSSESAPGVWHAFRWTVQSGTVDLGTLPIHPAGNSNAYVAGEAGWVVGDSFDYQTVHGFVWVPQTNTWSWPPLPSASPGMYDLGVIPGGDFSSAWDMNDRGQIVGFSGILADYWMIYPPPVLWEFSPSGTWVMTQLNMGSEGSPLAYTPVSVDINNLGQVVSNGRDPATGDSTILRWTSPSSGGAAPDNLGLPQSSTCPGASHAVQKLATNDRGQILTEVTVESSACPDLDSQSFLWMPGAGWTEIPANGVGFSHGVAFNNAGQVVGFEDPNGWWDPNARWEPFAWSAATGKEFLPPGQPCGSGYLGKALAINDVGQVAGVRGSSTDSCQLTTALWQLDDDRIGDLIDVRPDADCVVDTNCAFDDWPYANLYDPSWSTSYFCTHSPTPPSPSCGLSSDQSDGTTYGKIVATNGNRVAVVDIPPGFYPDDGVKILNFGDNANNPDVTLQACADQINFPVSGVGGAILTCRSLRLAVGAGDWTIEVPGNPVAIPAGAAVTVDEAGDGAVSITVDPASVATVMVGGTPLQPGETVVVSTNALPAVSITGPESGSVYAIGEPVPFTAAFTDVGDEGAHTATWTFGDATIPGTVTEEGGSGTVTDTYSFPAAGVYPVTLTVTDQGGASGSADTVGDLPAFVVVYDPNGGFVTGGGWFDSPPGAYGDNLALTGKASFGFVSKYQKGASLPTGQTEFQFKAGDLNFHSSSYDWLVCGGPKCKFKGGGTINGVAGYSFMLTAIDGQLPGGGGEDKIRMKIWVTLTGQVVYDNQLGDDDFADPTTVLGGGSIVIHKG